MRCLHPESILFWSRIDDRVWIHRLFVGGDKTCHVIPVGVAQVGGCNVLSLDAYPFQTLDEPAAIWVIDDAESSIEDDYLRPCGELVY